MSNFKKIVLVLLTVLIIGPLIFVGTCFPIGAWSFGMCFESSCSWFMGALFYAAWVLGAVLAIFVCYKIIKRITKK